MPSSKASSTGRSGSRRVDGSFGRVQLGELGEVRLQHAALARAHATLQQLRTSARVRLEHTLRRVVGEATERPLRRQRRGALCRDEDLRGDVALGGGSGGRVHARGEVRRLGRLRSESYD